MPQCVFWTKMQLLLKRCKEQIKVFIQSLMNVAEYIFKMNHSYNYIEINLEILHTLPKNCVAVTPAPVRVPTQRPLVLSFSSVVG